MNLELNLGLLTNSGYSLPIPGGSRVSGVTASYLCPVHLLRQHTWYAFKVVLVGVLVGRRRWSSSAFNWSSTQVLRNLRPL
ncbi:hypothetical protein R6Q59_013448 [Mikania micrantha]